MEINLHFNSDQNQMADILFLGAFNKKANTKSSSKKSKSDESASQLNISHWPKDLVEVFQSLKNSTLFKGQLGESFNFIAPNGQRVIACGLGEKEKLHPEHLRKEAAKIIRSFGHEKLNLTIDFDSFSAKVKHVEALKAIAEGLLLGSYTFDKYQSQKKKNTPKKFNIVSSASKKAQQELQQALKETTMLADSINLCRDFVNEPPNVLNSESYAKMIEKDAKDLKNVKVKILNKAQIKKENMNLLLAVNAGSGYEPRIAHLTYTPPKMTSKTKHIALVGKGLTFDTGGYSLKPSASMMGMKFDMAGSATVYAAFRAAALLKAPVKITCILGITDNAVSSFATMPDSVVKARSGKSVEILNTDAEGRLVLADALDYACDQGADIVINAATLTGAMLVALGTEVCGVFTNNSKLADSLVQSSKRVPEHLWPMPIIQEYRDDIKSTIADIKNIGTGGMASSAKAAVFLEHFIKNDIAWAHLDIAGVAGDQPALPYCPPKSASGLMVRTLVDFILNGKHQF